MIEATQDLRYVAACPTGTAPEFVKLAPQFRKIGGRLTRVAYDGTGVRADRHQSRVTQDAHPGHGRVDSNTVVGRQLPVRRHLVARAQVPCLNQGAQPVGHALTS